MQTISTSYSAFVTQSPGTPTSRWDSPTDELLRRFVNSDCMSSPTGLSTEPRSTTLHCPPEPVKTNDVSRSVFLPLVEPLKKRRALLPKPYPSSTMSFNQSQQQLEYSFTTSYQDFSSQSSMYSDYPNKSASFESMFGPDAEPILGSEVCCVPIGYKAREVTFPYSFAPSTAPPPATTAAPPLSKPTPKKHILCPYINCRKSFYRNHDVSRHLLVHTGQKAFECSTCRQKFSRKDALVRHLKHQRCWGKKCGGRG